MSGRSPGSGVTTAASAPHVIAFPLVQMDLDSGTLRLAGTPHDVIWNGATWIATLGIGGIEDIVETDTEVRGLSFWISGVTAEIIALALDEKFQGRPVTVRMAFVDASGSLQVDPNVWSGTLDIPTIDDGLVPKVTITAEHRLAGWDRPKLLRYCTEDQKKIDPTDTFFTYAAQMAEATITWPNKAFFRR